MLGLFAAEATEMRKRSEARRRIMRESYLENSMDLSFCWDKSGG
jgi:hypothetical protein